MNRISRAVTPFVLAGSMVLAGPAIAASADQAEALACRLEAAAPKPASDGNITGVGSRHDCGTTRVTLTVRIRKQRTGRPDVTVGSRTHDRFGNGNMTVVAGCDGSGKYFTETLSSTGGSVKSAAVRIC